MKKSEKKTSNSKNYKTESKNVKKKHKTSSDVKKNLDRKTDNLKKEKTSFEVKKKHKRYVSYNTRLIVNAFIFLLCLLIVALLFSYSIQYQKEQKITYTENGVADYRVFLKENDSFPGLKYLGKKDLNDNKYAYVTSLIDKIEIDYDYNFDIEKNSNIDFDYNIVGELLIFDSDGKNVFYSKKYNLLNNKVKKIENDKNAKINETISLDYDKYNTIANNFKNSNGLDTVSYFKVSLIVHKQNSENENDIKLNDDKEISVTIPLSKRSITIDIEDVSISPTSQTLVNKGWKILANDSLILLIIASLITIYFLFKTLKLLRLLHIKSSAYDKYVKKILTEYDRLIVESKTLVDFSNSNVIKTERFEELLDVHDNLQAPIIYYEVTKHQKCYLYVKNNNDVYLLQLKAVDMEGK